MLPSIGISIEKFTPCVTFLYEGNWAVLLANFFSRSKHPLPSAEHKATIGCKSHNSPLSAIHSQGVYLSKNADKHVITTTLDTLLFLKWFRSQMLYLYHVTLKSIFRKGLTLQN